MSPSVYMPTDSVAKPSSLTFSISSGLAISSATVAPSDAAIFSTTGYDSGCTAVMSSGLLAAADAQEARRLFEGLRPEARHRRQLHARAEAAVLVAVLHDLHAPCAR